MLVPRRRLGGNNASIPDSRFTSVPLVIPVGSYIAVTAREHPVFVDGIDGGERVDDARAPHHDHVLLG
jgi:hypothetical protein